MGVDLLKNLKANDFQELVGKSQSMIQEDKWIISRINKKKIYSQSEERKAADYQRQRGS